MTHRWQLTRRDRVVFGFTDHDEVLSFGGIAFEPETGFVASEIRSLGDLAVDAQDVQGALRSDRITETDIADGLWDNAAVEVWRVIWRVPGQRVLMRRGSIGAIRRGRRAFSAEVRALAHLLNQPVGRTFQYFCDAALGDARCGVDVTGPALRGSGTVTATEGDRRFSVATGLGGFGGGWFDFGVVEWTSGANAGRRGEIATHIPRLFGTMRLGGNIIWATDFREEQVRTNESSGGKGSPTIVTEGYRYFASFAVALCEGPIGGVCRIWADGKPFAIPGAVWRVHKGTEDQLPDPFIDALEGPGQSPAYRGVAYVVFEDLPLDSFGNRLPQLSFEVIRPSPDPGSMEQLVRAVNLIPAAGEFIYATETVTRTGVAPGAWETGEGAEGESSGDGASIPENENSVEGLPDLVASLNRLEAALPKVEAVSLVVAWFGTDLRAGLCRIKPGVESRTKVTAPLVWSVDGVTRADAQLISTVDGGPAYGGTPSDATVIHAIRELKARGKRVTFYPFILMDIPAGNALPDPNAADGALGQPAYPWRGRITCSPAAGVPGTADKTAAAAAQVAAFFGTAAAGDFAVAGEAVSFTGAPEEWGLRRMILHMPISALPQAGSMLSSLAANSAA